MRRALSSSLPWLGCRQLPKLGTIISHVPRCVRASAFILPLSRPRSAGREAHREGRRVHRRRLFKRLHDDRHGNSTACAMAARSRARLCCSPSTCSNSAAMICAVRGKHWRGISQRSSRNSSTGSQRLCPARPVSSYSWQLARSSRCAGTTLRRFGKKVVL